MFSASEFPTFICKTNNKTEFYGLPIYEYPGLFKVWNNGNEPEVLQYGVTRVGSGIIVIWNNDCIVEYGIIWDVIWIMGFEPMVF